MNLNKVGIVFFAKLHGLIFGSVGLLAGILYSFGGLIIDTFVTLGWISTEAASTPGLSYGTVLAFGALVGMPLLFGAAGFAVGFVEAIIYNIISKIFGGIKADFN